MLVILIGDTKLKLLSARKEGGSVKPLLCSEAKIPEGVYSDSLVFNPDPAADFLRSALKDGGFTDKRCRLVVDGTLVSIKTLTTPAVSSSKIMRVVKTDMAQIIGTPSSYVLDYEILDRAKTVNGTTYSVMATAISKQKVESCAALLHTLGFNPELMTITNSSLAAFAMSCLPGDKTYIVADCFGESLTVSVISRGIRLLTRSIVLNLSLVNILNNSNGLANEVISELSRIVGFYNGSQRAGERPPIENVYLTGDFMGDQNVCENIRRILSIQTSYLPVSASDPKDQDTLVRYAAAAGAVI